MRTRAAVAVALVLLPAIAGAQRIRIGSRAPGRAELPPTAPAVSRDMQYVRLPISMEGYQQISFFNSPGMMAGSPLTSWSSLGAGTRMDYRVAKNLSATFDGTTSMFGGPALVQSLELGMRLRRDRNEANRFYPFADVRYGYLFAVNSQARMMDFAPGSSAQQFGFVGGYSDGFGPVAGAGMEVAITRSFSIMTLASAMRANMTARDYTNANPAARTHFDLTAHRYTLGVRFNPVRLLPGTMPNTRGSR